MLEQFPTSPVSVVSDSYDIFKACKHIWGDKLKDRVMERSEDSCLVIRPDSGDPTETLLQVQTLPPRSAAGAQGRGAYCIVGGKQDKIPWS